MHDLDDLADYEASARQHTPWRRVLALFRPHVRALLIVLGLIVIAGIAGATAPFMMRGIIDDALPARDATLLVWLCGGLVGVAVLSAIAGVLQAYVSTHIGQQLMHELRVTLYEHLQSLSLAFFATARTGEVQSRMSSDIAGLQSLFTNTATDVARNVSVALTTVVAMILLDWRLALASLAFMPILLWLNNRVAALRERITFQQQERIADMSATVTESLSAGGFILGRTMGRAHHLVRLFRQTSSDVARLELRSHTAGQWEIAIIMFALDILPALTFFIGGLMLAQGSGVSIGTLVALIALQEQLLWPMLELFEARVELRKARALLTRVFGTLDTKPTLVEPANPVEVDANGVRGEIVFEDVSFSYPASERQTLDHVALRIPAGTHTAIVGSTGSGKSTLGYLLARLYDPDSGRVTLDGIDLKDLSFETLSHILGVVTQDPFLLNASVDENLRFAKPDASSAEIEQALKIAQLWEKVAGLPKGIQTEVGERGYQFSGGERQRLSLARTILRNPRVLLLDEATSALDPQTENALSAALSARHNRTVVSIAHRLSTVRHADQIVVLEEGRVVEMGSHDQLIATNGRYRQLATIG
ncbi:multidrug ABC transporter ATP-binding protein [Devosia sp. Root685]|uniref:ABC transporter ATP-binding protein n=1 Tax=Devosia sp. Root685 TaxID=1736587 RepID=UPI0006FE7F8E|nr:ABC transporter ATP-binding protein [Devosia sp. Root685]KRA98042.1 multidrug ABC transporter ATP-binding protein [Devosia sp. Root685]